MPYVAKPIDRNQATIMSLDALVEWNSVARIIDAFVDHLNLEELGFEKTVPSSEGRPCYDPQSLLKLFLYGYRKEIRSSRKLAAACVENIEVMWMMGGLRPDFRTIADFRKNNIDHLKDVFKEFVKRVTVDIETGFVSIDGSKFKAWNAKDNNFTIMKIDDRIKWLEDHTQEYLRLIEIVDGEEENTTLTKENLELKLTEAQERLERYRAYRKIMEEENLTQLSLTDADARLMKNKNGMEVSYNVQTAVDSETHLITEYQATNHPTDHGLIESTVSELNPNPETGVIEAVADKGYEQPTDIINCLENGIIPNVILPDGKDAYNLEVDYQHIENPDRSSTDPNDLKQCLHAGIVPDAYQKAITDVEVAEVRRWISDESEEEVKNPYGSEEKMKKRAAEGYYVRDPERDLVYCPGDAVLRRKCIKKSGATRYANKHACSICRYGNKCLSSKSRWKELDFSKDCLEKKARWMNPENEDPGAGNKSKRRGHFETKKVVRFKLRPDKMKMSQRMCLSEHPFGTIKRSMGATYFLLKGLRKVDGEFALMATGYNIARAQNMFEFDELMKLVMV